MSQASGSDDGVHRFVADTDAFIAYARLDCWPVIRANLGITTTTTCYRELQGHAQLDRGERYDEDAQARAEAAQHVLAGISDDACALNQQFCGEIQEVGEWSIVQLVEQNAGAVEAILMMDDEDEDRAGGGRAYVRRTLNLEALDVGMPGLGVPLAVLAQNEVLTEDEACAGIAEIAEREGWTSRSALERIWDRVPLDCEEEPAFM